MNQNEVAEYFLLFHSYWTELQLTLKLIQGNTESSTASQTCLNPGHPLSSCLVTPVLLNIACFQNSLPSDKSFWHICIKKRF